MGRGPSKRGMGVYFGSDVTESFLKDNSLSLVVRSHEVKDEGYSWHHKGKLITIFSAPNYCDNVMTCLLCFCGNLVSPSFCPSDKDLSLLHRLFVFYLQNIYFYSSRSEIRVLLSTLFMILRLYQLLHPLLLGLFLNSLLSKKSLIPKLVHSVMQPTCPCLECDSNAAEWAGGSGQVVMGST